MTKRNGKSNGTNNDLPGFESWNDILQVRYPTNEKDAATIPSGHPRWILIYGWGDAQPKHINKYCEKYRELFPHSAQVLVSCGISKAGYEPRIERRAQLTTRLVEEVFGKDDATSSSSSSSETLANRDILVHCMSNMGGIFYASTLFDYQRRYKKHMPHTLLVMDSTPGGTDYTLRNIMLWGGAAALKISRNTHNPFIVAHAYSSLRFIPARVRSFMVHQDPPGAWSRKAMNSTDYISPARTRFLYLYGKNDTLIRASDIESHIAQSKERGWQVDAERFDGTQHVSHMRDYPDRYWDAVRDSWNSAVAQRKVQ